MTDAANKSLDASGGSVFCINFVRRCLNEIAPPRQLHRYTASLMKYRNLKSIAHNFTHSFVSSMNYVDDGQVIDDLLSVARRGKPITVQWIPDTPPDMSLPPRVLHSIALRKSWLPSHIRNSGGDLEAIREFRTDIYLKSNKQIAVEARVVDVRGKEHVSKVYS